MTEQIEVANGIKHLVPNELIGIAQTIAVKHSILIKHHRIIEAAALSLGVCPERYLRNFEAYSLEEQLRLLSGRVALVGLGGLGGYVLELLARAGVGAVRVADGDEFCPSNLNRQLFATRRGLGGDKAAAAAARLSGTSTNS